MTAAACTTVARHLLVVVPAAAAGNRTCAGASTSYDQHSLAAARSGLPCRSSSLQRRKRQRQHSSGTAHAALPRRGLPVLAVSDGEIVEVDDLRGIRVLKNEDGTPRVEYLVKWKDGSPDTWEVATNLADNLLRDYEQCWWGAVKKGDEETVLKMMEVGSGVLARTVNEDRRSALHYAAAMGKAPLVERLVKAGAEVGLADKEGYTPLHMAAGYMHTTTIAALLAGGADPEQEDRQGRSPLELVESLRSALPAGNPMLVQRRMQLENVIQMLMANMFEDVEPAAVLDKRVVQPEVAETEGEKEGEEKEKEVAAAAGETRTEWLIKFDDEEEPVWVDARYVSQEVADDYESGLEYAQAECVLDMRQRGTMRKYLVRWHDCYPDTWEPEEHVSRDLVALWERQHGLFDASSDSGDSDAEGSSSGSNSAAGGSGATAGCGTGNATPEGMQLQVSPV